MPNRIDLSALERTARAADADNPGVCFNADHVDGYPSAESAMDHFNQMSPAMTMSLIRRIRQLEDLARCAIDEWAALDGDAGVGTDARIGEARAVLDAGAVMFGRSPVSKDDRWDIDQEA